MNSQKEKNEKKTETKEGKKEKKMQQKNTRPNSNNNDNNNNNNHSISKIHYQHKNTLLQNNIHVSKVHCGSPFETGATARQLCALLL